MPFDSDIKIAGDKPSTTVRKNKALAENQADVSKKEIENAKKLGTDIANAFIKSVNNATSENEQFDYGMLIQRQLLLAFTATVGIEQYCSSESLRGVAQKSFSDTLKNESSELYKTSSDTGAFSFYYLAYRRGIEVDRRMGQTFAMLCSHDGDPVYQELGEALYCWFLSVVRRSAKEYNLFN